MPKIFRCQQGEGYAEKGINSVSKNMDAHAVAFLNVFEKKLCLEVPLFQRQYVWNLEQQWTPLWEDISRKFVERLSPELNRRDAPAHFLGAMVLDQKQTPTTHVEKRQIIDGQQRLITFQIFLSAFRDFSLAQNCENLAQECDSFILNSGMMSNPEIEKYKVWPTQLDRSQFSDVVLARSRDELHRRYPLVYRKYARKPEPRPRMVEAYFFFYEQLTLFYGTPGSERSSALPSDRSVESMLDESLQVLKNALQVVVIDLARDDDPQVIFETLNARGEPLLPADLLRNFIFLRAARQGESQEELYRQYWSTFDDEFWRKELRQGRLVRPRSDLFMQHYLTSRQMTDVPIKHLYTEYKFWIDRQRPFENVRDELATLAREGEFYRRLIEPVRVGSLYPFASFLISFDISTVYPLLLNLSEQSLPETEWVAIASIIESYLVRRAVCGLTTQAYNRIFLGMLRSINQTSPSSDNIRGYLSNLAGDSVVWPTDDAFYNSWQNSPAYQILDTAKTVYILRRLNDTYLTPRNEQIDITSPLTIEHILPREWIDNWPLQDGLRGLTTEELWESREGDAAAESTNRRNNMLHSFGNLTLLTQPLNSGVSNSSWSVKKPQLLQSSLLPINQQLYSYETWDEEAITRRGNELFQRSRSLWISPTQRSSSA